MTGPVLKPVRETAPLDRARLADYLGAQGLALDVDREVRQFAGGLANVNYLVWIAGKPLVLRRPPAGKLPPGAHDMGREHRILSRLWEALPLAPRSLHFCADTSVIGVPFQLIEYREGVVVRGTDLSPVGNDPATCARLADILIETLARIHDVEPERVGLGDLGRPDGFVTRALEGWTKRGMLVAEQIPGVEPLIKPVAGWLSSRIREHGRSALIHNDFKLDNLILEPGTLATVAIVDWDQGTRGDPLFDLATLLSYWAEPNDPDCMHRLAQMPTAAQGFPRRAEVAERYARLTGRDASDLRPLHVLAMLKLSVVFLQLHRRFASGEVSDPRYAAFADIGRGLLAFTHDIAMGKAG